MRAMTYRILRRELERHLVLTGNLDALTAPPLRDAIDQLVLEECKHIVVDVKELEFIDSSGVGLLVSLFKRTKAHGGNVVIRGAVGQPLAIFKLLRMDRVCVDLAPPEVAGEDSATTFLGPCVESA
jgi:anti-sigma B factor antagonist